MVKVCKNCKTKKEEASFKKNYYKDKIYITDTCNQCRYKKWAPENLSKGNNV